MRDLSRRIRLAQASVIIHLKALQREGLIVKENKGIYPSFRANRDNGEYKLLKSQNLIWRIHNSGFISFLDEKLKPNCVVLFGSASNGEDTETSDVDIFVEAKEADLDFESFEKVLKRKINILFEPKIGSLGKELRNNILNGQVIYGYMKVF